MAEASSTTVRVVVQHAAHCELQVDPVTDAWVTAGPGLVVFVAFLAGCTAEHIPKAAAALLGVKIMNGLFHCTRNLAIHSCIHVWVCAFRWFSGKTVADVGAGYRVFLFACTCSLILCVQTFSLFHKPRWVASRRKMPFRFAGELNVWLNPPSPPSILWH